MIYPPTLYPVHVKRFWWKERASSGCSRRAVFLWHWRSLQLDPWSRNTYRTPPNCLLVHGTLETQQRQLKRRNTPDQWLHAKKHDGHAIAKRPFIFHVVAWWQSVTASVHVHRPQCLWLRRHSWDSKNWIECGHCFKSSGSCSILLALNYCTHCQWEAEVGRSPWVA